MFSMDLKNANGTKLFSWAAYVIILYLFFVFTPLGKYPLINVLLLDELVTSCLTATRKHYIYERAGFEPGVS